MKALRTLAWLGLALLVSACGSAHVVRAPGARASAPVKVSKPKYGATAIVKRGDTLYRIATDNGISALDLALWNGVRPPYTIYPGQRLRLYPGGGSATAAARPPVARVPAPRTGTASATAPVRSGASAPVSPPPVVATTPANTPFAWRWPVDGQLVGRFAAGEPTRQGIDVAGAAGAPVLAAADGVVVYSGSGLVGYGELVIVKHNEQWLSAYGHNRARLVNEGQLVKAGQQIAEMGHSGAARDMLHFEIRYNGKPVDPLQYLPRQ